MRKILYSPNFGAGWSTWNRMKSREANRLLIMFPPLIEAVEQGKQEELHDEHPVILALKDELRALGEDPTYLYLGGLDDLQIAEGEGDVHITEYDGAEWVMWRNDEDLWL